MSFSGFARRRGIMAAGRCLRSVVSRLTVVGGFVVMRAIDRACRGLLGLVLHGPRHWRGDGRLRERCVNFHSVWPPGRPLAVYMSLAEHSGSNV